MCKTIQILQNILDTLIRKFYVINKRTKLQHQTKRELFHNYYSKLWTFSCFFLMKNLREKWACGIYGNFHYSPIICIIFHFFFDVSSWGNLKYLEKSSSKITSFKWLMKLSNFLVSNKENSLFRFPKVWTFSWKISEKGCFHYSPIICIIFHFFFDVSLSFKFFNENHPF